MENIKLTREGYEMLKKLRSDGFDFKRIIKIMRNYGNLYSLNFFDKQWLKKQEEIKNHVNVIKPKEDEKKTKPLDVSDT